jgi:hypothetical protein
MLSMKLAISSLDLAASTILLAMRRMKIRKPLAIRDEEVGRYPVESVVVRAVAEVDRIRRTKEV